jgi:hypothetical protein
MTPDMKASGKRPTAMTGSGGSNAPVSTFMALGGMPHIYYIFSLFPHYLPRFSDPYMHVVGRRTWTRRQCPRTLETVMLPEVVALRTRWWMQPMAVVTWLLSLTP